VVILSSDLIVTQIIGISEPEGSTTNEVTSFAWDGTTGKVSTTFFPTVTEPQVCSFLGNFGVYLWSLVPSLYRVVDRKQIAFVLLYQVPLLVARWYECTLYQVN
jgi:hypothetical protein